MADLLTDLNSGLDQEPTDTNAPFNLGGKLGKDEPPSPTQDPPPSNEPPSNDNENQDPENPDQDQTQEPTELTEEEVKALNDKLESFPDEVKQIANALPQEQQKQYIETMAQVDNYITDLATQAETAVNQLQGQLAEYTPIQSAMDEVRLDLPMYKDKSNAEIMNEAQSLLEIKNDFDETNVGPLEMALYMVYDHFEKKGRDPQGNPIVNESQLGPAKLLEAAKILATPGVIEAQIPAIKAKANEYRKTQARRNQALQSQQQESFGRAINSIRQSNDFGPFLQKLESTQQGVIELEAQEKMVRQMYPGATDTQIVKETIKRAANQLGIQANQTRQQPNNPNNKQTQKQPPASQKKVSSYSDYRKQKQGSNNSSFQSLVNK